MSNILTNTTELQALLAKVNELPEASSGSSGNIDTCNINISSNTSVYGYSATTYNDDSITYSYGADGTNTINSSFTVNNVICGTIISVSLAISGSDSLMSITTSNNITYAGYGQLTYYFIISSSSDNVGTITFKYD